MTDAYAIRQDELARIAQLPPENRGSHVRATQQTSFSDSYAEPDPLPPDDGPSGTVVIVGPGHFHHHHPPGFGERGGPAALRRQPAHLRDTGGASPGATGGASAHSAGKGSDADAAVAIAVAALVVTTGAFSVAAFTEGPRFDGWVWVPPEQQILVKPKNATPYWTPLADLTPQEAASAEGAELLPAKAQLLERAPLDRVGLSTSLEFGGSAMRTTPGERPSGFMARYALGGFPLKWLGILGNAGFSARGDNGTVFDGRLGLELRLMPLHVGGLHLGGYGELGHAWLVHDVAGGTLHGDGAYYGGGGLIEIDLTTRLGLLLRGGAAVLPPYAGQTPALDDNGPFTEFSIGLAVY